MVTISEAKNQRSDVNVEGVIADKEEPREVKTRYGTAKVCNVYLTDDDGRIKMSLWGDDIEKFNNGDRVRITGGYTNTFRNEVQLNVPKKNGKIEKI